jgi:hypothetical protein
MDQHGDGDSHSSSGEGGIMRIVMIPAIVVLTVLLLYVGSYIALSADGCYEPAAIGLGGVKSYQWAPRGFVDNYNWKRWPMTIYYPLYALDMRFWHTLEKSRSGEYPVDEVKREDIWKVYKAFGF